jgi:uncharacterized protein (UPF0335 family)
MTDVHGITAEQLRSYIERIERLEEAKGNGFDVKTMRQILKIRKMDASDRDEQEALLDLYMHALGMAGPPAGASEEG